MNEFMALKRSEKQLAVEKIINMTLGGSIYWEKENGIIQADYESRLRNHIEIETFTEKNVRGITMTKITITNENGKLVLHNGDITADTHRRLLNSINLQIKESNVLLDFI